MDHGKTTLVRALTGVDTDRLEAERRRGLTIEPGFAYVDHDGERWGFVDVPGHHRFVGNMLSGVAGVDAALLVIAADDGPMPQTREHLAILDLLDIRDAVIAVTRIDLVDADRLAAVDGELDELLAGTSLQAAPRVPVSGHTGEGVEDLRRALGVLARTGSRRLRSGDGFRFAIDRVFRIHGTGLVVTGCVHAGRVRAGDELALPGHDDRARVRSLRARDREVDEAGTGDRVALNLAGIDGDAVSRGDWLLAPEIATSRHRFDARLRCLEGVVLRSGMEVHVHHGADHSLGRITLLDGPEEAPRVHLSVREPLAVFHGDRFVVRDGSARHTLAGGRVLDPAPPPRGRSRPQRLRALDVHEGTDPEEIVRGLLALRPLSLGLDELARGLNRDPEALIAALPEARIDTTEGGRVLRDRKAWEALQQDIRAALARFHAAQPQLAGMGVDELRAVLTPRPGPGVLTAALRDTVRSGRIARSATRFHLPGHRPELVPADRDRWTAIRPHLEEPLLQPPVVHDLARTLDAEPAELEALLTRVHHTGGVIRVAANRFMLPDAVTRLAHCAEALGAEAEDGLFDARSYKQAAGIGRNLAIDVLEFLDRSGLTRRRGNVRLVVGSAEDLFGPEPTAGN
ncbi:MAG: selenocysteine-specific translation elongation factor [Gammaproteobacteria bacterium]|nr:selenocysteine-specific translation elongation factor [Gammaproteobacteria bacterium]